MLYWGRYTTEDERAALLSQCDNVNKWLVKDAIIFVEVGMTEPVTTVDEQGAIYIHRPAVPITERQCFIVTTDMLNEALRLSWAEEFDKALTVATKLKVVRDFFATQSRS